MYVLSPCGCFALYVVNSVFAKKQASFLSSHLSLFLSPGNTRCPQKPYFWYLHSFWGRTMVRIDPSSLQGCPQCWIFWHGILLWRDWCGRTRTILLYEWQWIWVRKTDNVYHLLQCLCIGILPPVTNCLDITTFLCSFILKDRLTILLTIHSTFTICAFKSPLPTVTVNRHLNGILPWNWWDLLSCMIPTILLNGRMGRISKVLCGRVCL